MMPLSQSLYASSPLTKKPEDSEYEIAMRMVPEVRSLNIKSEINRVNHR